MRGVVARIAIAFQMGHRDRERAQALLDGALREVTVALDELRGQDEPVFAAFAAFTAGSLYTALGRYDDALRSMREARDLAERVGGDWLGAGSRMQLAILAVLRGRPDEARDLLEEALELSLAARSTAFVTLCLAGYAQLAFAGDLAPAAMSGYLAKDPKGLMRVARLPATDDPIATRVERIRQRDATVIDTVNGYYANFSDQMSLSYGQWRRASFEEIEKEQRALNQARTRTYLGAAAVLASVLVPNQCSPYDYNCQRVQSAARYGGAIGGTAAFLSGLKKYADAKVHAQALKEMSETFQSEVAPQVIDVEGRTLRLTGTAEEQYRQWRRMLHALYLEENGTPVQLQTEPAPVPSEPVAVDAAH